MNERSGILVVGGDSLVGGGAIAALRRRGLPWKATTRRPGALGPDRVLLDFESAEPFRAPPDMGAALVIAAATNYDRCETDPMARVINVELIPRTVGSLLEQGLHVTFISTNSVFGGEKPWPGEDDAHEPGIAYARQKSEGEAAVLAAGDRAGARDRLSITRLTKIMNAGVSPLPAWFASWRQGKPVSPFADLVFAPITQRWVGEALVTIAEKRAAGNLHLSGAENVDYVTFARLLAERTGFDPALIEPTTATAKGVHIAYKPTYSGLGMARTTRLTGLEPMPFAAMLDDIARDLEQPDISGNRT